MKSVKDVCKLSGVSRRTLQYYDEIGLLPPSAVKKSGYRQYDNDSLRRLWSILFYKELGISLSDIALLLGNSKETEIRTIRRHKKTLLEKQARLQKMISSVDCILEDRFDISMLRDFDRNKIESVKKIYASEIKAVMDSNFFLPVAKSGILPDNISFIKYASKIISMDFGNLIALGAKVKHSFEGAMEDGPYSSAAKEAVLGFNEFINMVIPCDDVALRSIGQSYLDYKGEQDERFPGLAEFVYEAIMQKSG